MAITAATRFPTARPSWDSLGSIDAEADVELRAPLRPLREDEIREYDEQGVVLARGLFPEAWIERMASVRRPLLRNTA